MYTENDLFFPYPSLSSLRHARGPQWAALIDEVSAAGEWYAGSLAVLLMLARLNGCASCETDSFRAMRGCQACALQTLRRFKGADAELIALYTSALADVQAYAAANPRLPIAPVSTIPLAAVQVR
jgi:hypothetical protein